MPVAPLHLVILDPGLHTHAGHHVSIVKDLGRAASASKYLLSVYSRKDIDKELQENLTSSISKIVPHFSCDLYQFYHNEEGDRQAYLLNLALEYKNAIRQQVNNVASDGFEKANNTVFLLHTVMDLQARALNLALEALDREGIRPKCLVLMMFHPQRSKWRSDALNKLDYSLAFKPLHHRSNVTLYASDAEIAACMAAYLRISALPIHPAVVINSRTRQGEKDRPRQVLLYLGDAKRDKGFDQLPGMIESGLLGKYPTTEFVIQYTLTSEDPVLHDAVKRLNAAKADYDNLEVIEGFVDDSEIYSMIQSSQLMLLNYSQEEYQHKNSGVLWLAGYFNTSVIIPDNCWLYREAQRLNLDHHVVTENGWLVALQKALNTTETSHPLKSTETKYKLHILQPFDRWLFQVINAGM